MCYEVNVQTESWLVWMDACPVLIHGEKGTETQGQDKRHVGFQFKI